MFYIHRHHDECAEYTGEIIKKQTTDSEYQIGLVSLIKE